MPDKIKMTRQQMQDQTVVIESLLSAIMAMHSDSDKNDAFELIQMAQDRACQLGSALDSVNAQEEAA